MRPLRHLLFALNSAWQNFWRNAGVSLAAVLSITLMLILAGACLLLGHSFARVLQGYEQRISVIDVSVADGTPLSSVYDFEAQLRARPEVVSVRFLTKDQELRRFAEDPRNQALIQQLQGNPMPAKIEVRVTGLSHVREVDAMARRWRGVDRSNPTDYEGDFIDNMLTLSRWLTIAGLGMLAVLTLVSVVIVMNSIRTAVYHRRQDIEVMRLVGASEWFVRWPFLLEGLLTGVLASALALAVLVLAYRPFVVTFQTALFFLPLSYDPSFVSTLGKDLLVAGAFLGVVGSYVSVRRFVRI
ncbi:MAG TPA: permease-like cell division protein FtsX [Candidatus Dormibacteraeota bacterium]|nr:permease-like cell division protein FtsX [Candidatus Dormibacteraeota bacterium]